MMVHVWASGHVNVWVGSLGPRRTGLKESKEGRMPERRGHGKENVRGNSEEVERGESSSCFFAGCFSPVRY